MYTSLYNPNRQYHFVLRQATLFKQRWIIAAAALFGVMLLISLFTAYTNPNGLAGMIEFYTVVFVITGLIFTSQVFMELHAPNQAYAFLTLPVSTLEKLLGSWFITSPLYVLVYTAATYAIYLISTLVSGFAVSPASFFTTDFLYTIASYMVIQTIFLWGASFFRKNNFLKTVLSLLVLFITLGLWGGLMWLLFIDKFEITGATDTNIESTNDNIVKPFMQFLFWGILGPYMLLTTYFTLKERQL
ncbi:MAG: hypothetical protein KY428_10950 [Bacteroidetes bacterium]|nr:hypothetical protein [Bacteroidota bacterium]